jgi:hypothetical protein
MTKFLQVLTASVMIVLLAGHSAGAQEPQSPSSEELAKRTVQRRAVDAAIWGQPIVSFDAMRQAYFRDGKAKYNDVIWWPRNAGWKNQSLTVNTSVRYIYFFFNTKNDGPVVLELPAGVDGASFFGTITDAWFVPLVDIGEAGHDKGSGGKYLVLPPGFKGAVPRGYIAVRPATYNTFTLVRSILKSGSEADVSKGDALVKKIKLYPLSQAANPPQQRFVDMTDTLYEGLVRYDESFYTSLARMLNEEPIHPRDLERMGMLLPLGIEKGKEFKPDAAMTAQLKAAAEEARAWLVDGLPRTSTERFWPDRNWVIPAPPIALATLFKWEVANYFDVDSRGIALASFFGPSATIGKGSFYLGVFRDASGQPLRGENTYRLRIPANAPVREFWAMTVYNRETAALFRESTRITVGSVDKDLRKNADGSVDVIIGPKAPAGQEANWIYTPPGKSWWPWFRFYGPEKALFDKSWKLPDIEKMP